jgi:hypothetical protein
MRLNKIFQPGERSKFNLGLHLMLENISIEIIDELVAQHVSGNRKWIDQKGGQDSNLGWQG